jgi:site-specific DNA-cytosine methylase
MTAFGVKEMPLNYLDLFSGIGGFALGAERAGMEFDGHYFSEVLVTLQKSTTRAG